MKNEKPVVCTLLGDAAGVGPEIVAKACQSGFVGGCSQPLLLGDERVLKRAMKLIGADFAYKVIKTPEEFRRGDTEIVLLDTADIDAQEIELGCVSAVCGKAVNEAIAKSAELYRGGFIDAICYAPFNKTSMKMDRKEVEGEQTVFKEAFNASDKVDEINFSGKIWTSRVTSHIPLGDIRKHLTYDKILASIRQLYQIVRSSGVPEPRIAVCALNPHGGENGMCGTEEIDLIIPATEAAAKEGIHTCGVLPADTIFIGAFEGEYDAVVTMYHDQGQIALKLKSFDDAVTIQAGFPLPITTPAHGTAFAIAGKGIARTSAFESAYRFASLQSQFKNR